MNNEEIENGAKVLLADVPKIRIAWNRGKRKPYTDDCGYLWCNCLYPKLTSNIGRGQALCLLC